MRTDQNKNRQAVIGNSLLFYDKADFSVGQYYGLHHRAAHRDLLVKFPTWISILGAFKWSGQGSKEKFLQFYFLSYFSFMGKKIGIRLFVHCSSALKS